MDKENYFNAFPILTTRRLILRAIELGDAQQILKIRSNNMVNQFILRDPMDNLEKAENLIARVAQGYEQKQSMGWAGVLKGSETLIGTCGFNQFDFPNKHAEIGGEMSTEYWGKGIAQEAFEAIIKFGQNELDLQTIEAKVSPNNRSAIALLNAYGFVKEAHYKNRIFFEGQFFDIAVYTLHKN
jgi:ribosomal-protein-alanine N-acetyltransferase